MYKRQLQGSGGGGGLSAAQVDMRIKVWARTGGVAIPSTAIDVSSANEKTLWRTAIGAAADTIQHLLGILTGTFPFNTGMNLAGRILQWNATGTKLENVLPTASAGPTSVVHAHDLDALAAIPALPSTYHVGDIINVQGVLHELVAEADESNVLSGVAVARTSPYVGPVSYTHLTLPTTPYV